MRDRSEITNWLTDMDGVLWHEGRAIPGAPELIEKWASEETNYLVLTNTAISFH